MLLNTTKKQEMVIDFRSTASQPTQVNIQGLDIETVDSIKYLGVYLNNKLDGTHSTATLFKKGQSRLLWHEQGSAVHFAIVCWIVVCHPQTNRFF